MLYKPKQKFIKPSSTGLQTCVPAFCREGKNVTSNLLKTTEKSHKQLRMFLNVTKAKEVLYGTTLKLVASQTCKQRWYPRALLPYIIVKHQRLTILMFKRHVHS